jgi:hypothetical protein
LKRKHIGLWSDKKYEVKKIEDIPNVGKLYHVEGQQYPLTKKRNINLNIYYKKRFKEIFFIIYYKMICDLPFEIQNKIKYFTFRTSLC